MASKEIKHLVIHFTKEVKDIYIPKKYTENNSTDTES